MDEEVKEPLNKEYCDTALTLGTLVSYLEKMCSTCAKGFLHIPRTLPQ